MEMYTGSDKKRQLETSEADQENYRSAWRRDYARLIHCPSFRRLQGKTQLFPGVESDFFRNRLTHSLEVAQIAKSIAIRLNDAFNVDIEPDITEFAGLAHDLGHPPFGHQGEEALDLCMMDFGGFEGNAQTLRILTRLEKKVFADDIQDPLLEQASESDHRIGLNLSFRSLASILKYDNIIPVFEEEREKYRIAKGQEKKKPVKGYYDCDKKIVEKIKNNVVPNLPPGAEFKTIECKIMDIADDIAYSTYDLEDAFKAGFLTPFDLIFAEKSVAEKVRASVEKIIKKAFTEEDMRKVLVGIFQGIFDEHPDLKPIKINKKNRQDYTVVAIENAYRASKNLASDGYIRNGFTSKLVSRFIKGITFKKNNKFPALSDAFLQENELIQVEVLKRFTYESQILSPKLKVAEYRGKEIVTRIFKTLSEDGGHELLPDDFKKLYHTAPSEPEQKRVICDYVAGMTDKYAIEYYGRITSENPETIFKPF